MRFVFKAKLLQAAPMSDEAQNRLRQNFSKVVESKTIGDYEFYLVEGMGIPYPQIAMQKSDKDFTSIEQQTTKIPEHRGKFDMGEAQRTVTQWVKKYKTLLVGTYDDRKLKFYEKILIQMGFNLENLSYAGLDIVVIRA